MKFSLLSIALGTVACASAKPNSATLRGQTAQKAGARKLGDDDDECPNGNGIYCGGSPGVPGGLDATILYHCNDGEYEVEKECDTDGFPVPCWKAPDGHDDYCSEDDDCPYGGGDHSRYCGNSTGGSQHKDPGILYECNHGEYTEVENCTASETACVVMPPRHDDVCGIDSGTGECPNDTDGIYCGRCPLCPSSLDDATLYDCCDGVYTVKKECDTDLRVPCWRAPDGYDDYCSEDDDCPYGGGDDSRYCGGSTGGSQDLEFFSLYSCHDGNYTKVEDCREIGACIFMPPHHDDVCDVAPPPS